MSNILRYLEQLQGGEDHGKVEADTHEFWGDDEGCDALKDPEASPKPRNGISNEASLSAVLKQISKSPLLAAYRLQPRELMLIAKICARTRANGDQDFNVRDICEMLPGLEENLAKQYSAIVDLIDREILSALSLHGQDYHYDLRALYGTYLRLNGLLWNLILGQDPIKAARGTYAKGVARQENPVDSALKMIGVLFLNYPELTDDFSGNSGACYGRSVNLMLDACLQELASSQSATPWKKLCARHKLSGFWQKSLLLIDYYNREQESEVPSATLASLLACNSRERQNYIEKLSRDNLLAVKGLINPRNPLYSKYLMELSPSAVATLHGKENDNPGQTDIALADSRYLSRIDPTQGLKQLILEPQTRDLIVTVINRLRNPKRESFASWGLVGASLTADRQVQQGCNILLHGVPGTGKSFIAGVIANELKRPLIQINANAIRGMYYGETEKQARELFKEMRETVKSLAPVFLLNEGDQLIHRRLDSAERSADLAENTIQSVFLEEMESFPGILIVTTNLAENLDQAMSRRFHYKLEIKAPDYESRLSLWRLHLPDSIPGASLINVKGLAKDFPFTGGQISLVVQNACHEAFLRGKGARLSLDDLRKYAVLESGTSFERPRQTIGFAL